MNVVLAGYTAAGKTTLARRIAARLGSEHVWAAGLLLEELGYDVNNESTIWFNERENIARERARSQVDLHVDMRLTQHLTSSADGVYDARYLAWACAPGSAIRLWLESDLRSRARKCAWSQRPANVDPARAAVHVHEKDLYDVRHLSATRCAVFSYTPEVFDLTMDVSSLAAASTDLEVDEEAHVVSQYALALIAWHGGQPAALESLLRAEPDLFWRVAGQDVAVARWALSICRGRQPRTPN